MKKNLLVNKGWFRVMVVSISLGIISRPVDFLVGYYFGVERFLAFSIAFGVSALIGILGEIIWWIVMSDLRNTKEK